MKELALAPIHVTLGDSNKAFANASPAITTQKQESKHIPVNNKQPTVTPKKTSTPINTQALHNAVTTVSSAEAQNFVRSRLHREIDNYFFYPMLARRNGWQGKVILGLSVTSQGSIHNVHIKHGSGYKVLDESALDTLQKIKQIYARDGWIDFDDLDIIIPVIYRLQKG